MHVILVCIDNFQEHILINIKQLIRLNHDSIFVITNSKFFDLFDEFKNNIVLVNCDTLKESYNYRPNTNYFDTKFRNGFWGLTSKRFFLIHSFMKQRNLTDVFHIENDVLLYHNCDILTPNIDRSRLCVPADSYNRSIASIIFIPTCDLLGSFLDSYVDKYNDMENLSYAQQIKPQLFDNFPICIDLLDHNPVQKYVTRDFKKFNMIFDAAAIGQYLGGVDPRNIPGDTKGFVNETCVIKYDQFEFIWQQSGNFRRPFMKFDELSIPIFNLHIHSKNLAEFI